MTIRSILRLIAVAVLGIALSVPPLARPRHSRFRTAWTSQTGSPPEGITIGPGATAYFGSRANGDIYAVSLRTGEGTVVSEGPALRLSD